MKIDLIDKNSQKEYLSTLQDPFKSSSIYKIQIEIGKQLFEDEISCVATVRFESGATRGAHKIKNPNFMELVKELDLFINSIE